MVTAAKRQYALLETVAALSGELYGGDQTSLFFSNYETSADRYEAIITAAIVFESEVRRRRQRVVWDETHDWIVAIEYLADALTRSTDPVVLLNSARHALDASAINEPDITQEVRRDHGE